MAHVSAHVRVGNLRRRSRRSQDLADWPPAHIFIGLLAPLACCALVHCQDAVCNVGSFKGNPAQIPFIPISGSKYLVADLPYMRSAPLGHICRVRKRVTKIEIAGNDLFDGEH